MNKLYVLLLAGGLLGGMLLGSGPAAAAEIKLSLPLGRTAYQTNEQIDLSVTRGDVQALPAAELTVGLTSADGSMMSFTFPLAAVAAGDKGARATEHLHLNGWLLRPGHYTVKVKAYEATATTQIDLFSHLRRSTFKTIDWGSRVTGNDMALLGEDSMGFNLIYGQYRQNLNVPDSEATLRGSADYMECCTMGGAHQMDMRPVCDWSDPYVLKGGTARTTVQAFLDRTKPNALGVHFYDEPGLTWENGTPHDVSAQKRSFKSAFGKDRIAYTAVKPDDADAVAKWQFWGRWKESFMEAAWKDARFGVEQVKPDFISATQSVYGWSAYADGYYFNVARSLPVISGHGGYDDGPGAYLYPVYTHEMGRMRQTNKPNWYLPMWGNATDDELFRLEQYLCFAQNLQGFAKPPDPSMNDPYAANTAHSIVETNKLGQRLGSIYEHMQPRKGEVAMLYSLSQDLDAEIKSGMQDNYLGGGQTRGRLLSLYVAAKMTHIPFTPVVEEDILDGSLAADYKAIVLTNINYLDSKVVAVLEDYIAKGGIVLMTDDCQQVIKGAKKLGVAAVDQDAELEKVWATNQKESMRLRAAGLYFKAAKPLADALKAQLAQVGIMPVCDCDNEQVMISRHGLGDIEYDFAVNATWDEQAGEGNSIKRTTATIGFPADGRTIYDAVRGGTVAEYPGKKTSALFRFGAGEMRVFARTARPIGGVEVDTPIVNKDLTLDVNPITVTIDATLVDAKNTKLAGTAPMQVRVIDPLGAVRYDLYRATDRGAFQLALPLAANDPAGTWHVIVTELLDNHSGTAAFTYRPGTQCGVLAGATERAVYFGNDRDNIYRMLRTHQDVTIVKGTSNYDDAAAARLTEILNPWGVRCTTVNAADVNKARSLTADEARAWSGGVEMGGGVAGAGNHPGVTGFAINGPVILVGNTADNPLITFVNANGFLPYQPSADFPGRSRGYLAWQRDAVGLQQESITVIANDADGMAEAVGSLYEATAGIDPMTRYAIPTASMVTPATQNGQAPELAARWQTVMPDRVLTLTAAANGDITAISLDGSSSVISKTGKVTAQQTIAVADVEAAKKASAGKPVVPDTLKGKLALNRVAKFIATSNGITAVAYWGGTLQTFGGDGAVKSRQLLSQDISALTWAGNTLIVGQSDGNVVALTAK